MKTLHVNRKGEFISIKLMDFYEKRDITIKYVASYMYEENGLVEKR